MDMQRALEAGGIASSLSGANGKLGRAFNDLSFFWDNTTYWRMIAPNNPKREWLVIQNLSSSGDVLLNFWQPDGINNPFGLKLTPSGVYIIDTENPWTGAVYAYLSDAAVNSAYLIAFEGVVFG